jgi:hypothetical protein
MRASARFGNGHNGADRLPPHLIRWQVRESIVCAWHDLAESYSEDQMWRFLQQGRYSHAIPLELTSAPVPDSPALIA